MDTADSGTVTVGNVTLEGHSVGDTSIDVSVSQLGDEAGNGYVVGSTPDATLSVKGQKSGTADDAPGSTAQPTEVVISLEAFPDGFRQASFRIEATNGANVTAIDPVLLTGNQFRIADGGTGSSFASVQVVDLSGEVNSFEEPREFVRLTFDREISKAQIRVEVQSVENDAGDTVSSDRIIVETSQSVSFTTALPGTEGQGPPTDPDGDGLYEDVDGDGDSDFEDAIALAFVTSSELSQPQSEALDFDGDGDVDMDDAVELAFQ
jgi:PKD repeat protein